MLDEAKDGHPSHVTEDLEAEVDLATSTTRRSASG